MSIISKRLNSALLLIIATFIIFVPFSKPAAKLVFFALPLWVLINILNFRLEFYKNLIPKTILNKPLFFFLSALVISTLFSVDFYHSQSILFERLLIYFVCLFLGYAYANSKNNFNFFIFLLLLSSLAVSLGGLWNHLRFGGRLFYSFGISINFSAFLALYLPINYSFALFGKKKSLKIIAAVNTVLLSFCLIWHASRAVLLAILVSILFFTFVRSKKITLFLVIALIVLIFFLPLGIKDRGATTFNLHKWGDRVALWGTALTIFQDFPVFGAGPGMYEKLLYVYGPSSGYSESFIHLHAHNTYLEVLSELGLAGLIGFLSIFILFFKNTLKYLKSNYMQDIQAVELGLSCGILATLIFALSSSLITVGVQDAMFFWFLLGAAAGLNKIRQK